MFGPKGYGYGGGAGTLSMDDGKGYKSNPNEVDHKAKAYIAPKKPLVPSNSATNVKGRWLWLWCNLREIFIFKHLKLQNFSLLYFS